MGRGRNKKKWRGVTTSDERKVGRVRALRTRRDSFICGKQLTPCPVHSTLRLAHPHTTLILPRLTQSKTTRVHVRFYSDIFTSFVTGPENSNHPRPTRPTPDRKTAREERESERAIEREFRVGHSVNVTKRKVLGWYY
jgi:hypothetical protein